MGMLVNYLTIGAIVKKITIQHAKASQEEKLHLIEIKMLEKGFCSRDYFECMSFILELLKGNNKKEAMSILTTSSHQEVVEQGK